jgi:prepilin-type N-terminal cleavage/methylation domain-containing protein
MKNTKHNVDGFTLIEMLIVMAVIAITAAIVAPRAWKTIDNLKLRSAVRNCLAVMRYAKSAAVSSQKDQKISFMLNNNDDPNRRDYYTFQKVSRSSGNENEEIEKNISDEYEEGLEEKTELKQEKKRKVLDAGMSLSWRDNPDSDWEEEGEYEITFYSRGFASGGEIRFAFLNDGKAYILKLDPVTGRAKTSIEKE